MQYHSLTIEQCIKELDSNPVTGLHLGEAEKRQKKYGPNLLAEKKNQNLFFRFLAQFADFMIIILIIAAAVSFLMSLVEGHADFVDPIIILAIILINASLGVIQEAKAEKSLEALKKMSAPHALVIRDGIQTTLPSKDLVPGDIIVLETGYFIPADARLLTSLNLKVDESALTGESHPAAKRAEQVLKEHTLLGDRCNMVPATGIITYGRGTAVVTATGMNTEVGHIARMIMEDSAPQTPLQKRLAMTSKSLGIAALLICVCIFFMGILKRRPPFDMFMTSVSLAVAAIPEGLPAIVTIMLSLGVQRMAKKNAVIRKLPAVETLGSATVICSDKTGTLTQNKMTVTAISSVNGGESLTGAFPEFILSLAAQCNNSVLRLEDKSKSDLVHISGEPTENALALAALNAGIYKPKLDLMNQRIYELPFDSNRKMMTTVHRSPKGAGSSFCSVTKGAPDILLSHCILIYENGKIIPLSEQKKRKILNENISMTSQALRVIAVAYKYLSHFSPSGRDISVDYLENSLIFVGLIGMIDPPRPQVKEAVLTCKKAGIKPIMITGDHISTACAIGKELGIISSNSQAITGQELNQFNEKDLQHKIKNYQVFARVSPEHKVRIVKAFQNNGEVVAMTGDGVNDAPALKAADIGCAMGITGTDVAKNAADMILTDDNFTTIVSAVKEGRGIYDNIRKSVHFLLSSNIGEIITIFTAILFGLASPLVAVQLLWVNLVTDSLPAISLGVEPPDQDIMKRPPISPKKGMFADGLILKIVFEGMMIGFLALTAYVLGVKILPGASLPLGRTMCFAVLSLSQLFHSFNMRSEHSLFTIGLWGNKKLLLSFVLCCFLQIAVISIPPLPSIFKVIPLSMNQWLFVFILSAIPIPLVELQKMLSKKSV